MDFLSLHLPRRREKKLLIYFTAGDFSYRYPPFLLQLPEVGSGISMEMRGKRETMKARNDVKITSQAGAQFL